MQNQPAYELYPDSASLPSDLRRYVDGAGLITVFKHPYFTSLLPMALPAKIEDIIALRRQRAQEALEGRGLSAYLIYHERPYRLTALMRWLHNGNLQRLQTDTRAAAEFWRAAAWAWTDAEMDESDPLWTEVIAAPVPHRGFISGPEGRRFLRTLPDTITVYRGTHADSPETANRSIREGWSWTTDQDTARFFARRFAGQNTPYLATAAVPRPALLACLLKRGESEVLIEPNSVDDITIERITE